MLRDRFKTSLPVRFIAIGILELELIIYSTTVTIPDHQTSYSSCRFVHSALHELKIAFSVALYAGFFCRFSSHSRAAPSPSKVSGIHEYLSLTPYHPR